MKQHLKLSIIGKVQGVGFRYSAKEYADRLDIRGYARNLRDGSVSIEVEGEEDALKNFVDWCKSGTSLATVQQIDVQEGGIKGYREFQIY